MPIKCANFKLSLVLAITVATAASHTDAVTPGIDASEPKQQPADRGQVIEQDLRLTVLSLYQRLFAQSSQEKRPELLLEMLNSDLEQVRILGLRLANADAVSGRQPSEAVIEFALTELRSDSIDAKRQAAQLLLAVPSPRVAREALQILTEVKDPLVMSRISSILQRAPLPNQLETLLPLHGELTDPDAQQSVVSAIAATPLPELSAAHERVSKVFNQTSPEHLPTTAVRFYVAQGRFDTLVQFLVADRQELATTAAQALAAESRFVPQLLSAAQTRPHLYVHAVSALSHAPTLAAYEIAHKLQAPDDAARRSGTAAIFRDASAQTARMILNREPDNARKVELIETRLPSIILDTEWWENRLSSAVPIADRIELSYVQSLAASGRIQDAFSVFTVQPPSEAGTSALSLYIDVALRAGAIESALSVIETPGEVESRLALIAAYERTTERLSDELRQQATDALSAIQSSASNSDSDGDNEGSPAGDQSETSAG